MQRLSAWMWLAHGGAALGFVALGSNVALAGTVTMMLGGFLHAASGAAKRTEQRFWIAARQAGMTPWLAVASIAAIAAFFLGFSGLFTFYTFAGFPQEQATNNPAGWISLPHTSVLVLGSRPPPARATTKPPGTARAARKARAATLARPASVHSRPGF